MCASEYPTKHKVRGTFLAGYKYVHYTISAKTLINVSKTLQIVCFETLRKLVHGKRRIK